MNTHVAENSKPSAQPAQPGQLGYLPGLDGLRALAVLAVLVYHADLGIYGGYLGVESFFVISGFLITTILLADWHAHQRIDLKRFWVRRVRRLFPALFVMLAGTLAATALLLPNEFEDLTHATVAAIGYATNWYMIATGQSYFDAGDRPPLLQHLWSLAIEEQFYLLWPLVCAFGLRFLRRAGLLAVTIGLALASLSAMALLYDPGADPSRIYYGTDTRASGLLIGAALALAWRAPAPGAQPARRLGMLLDLAGLASLLTLLVAYVWLNAQHPLLYRGGLAAVALLTALVIAAAVHPAARLLPWLLERQPLRWIGLRSYGIYLWHWPVFMLTRPGLDVATEGWIVQVLRFALALALAAISYALVEQPIRHGALGYLWQAIRLKRSAEHVPALAQQRVSKFTFPQWQVLLSVGSAGMFWPSAPEQRSPAERPALPLAPQSKYQGWRGLIATSLLMIGMAFIGASISLSTMRGVASAHPSPAPTAQAMAATPAITVPATSAAAPTITGQTSSAPAAGATVAPAGTPATTAPAAIDPALAAEFQRILDSTVQDQTIPGMVVTIKLSDGTTWTGASGLANTKDGTPMQTDTRVRIGSLSKMLTAVVVLQLVEEQTIRLDQPVSTWLSADLVPNGDQITVQQLLQHTSGLYDYLEDRKFVSESYQEPERNWKPEELVAYATQFPGSFKPGTPNAWDYSSTNYVILAMIVEQATGQPFDQELDRRIFTPLALTDTQVASVDPVEGPQAHGYSKDTDQTNVAMSFAYGTANIVTTADDLRQFGDALFGAKLLKPETLQIMQQYVNGKGQYDMPALEYGLGLMHNQLPLGQESDDGAREAGDVIGHIGGFGGFRSALWYAPKTDTLVVLTVNQAAVDPNELATQIFDTILKHSA